MDNFESKLKSLRLRQPSPALDERVVAAKPESTLTDDHRAVRQLSPIPRRRLMSRIVIIAAAATIMACIWLGTSDFGTPSHSTTAFAQVLEQIKKAKTMTWNHHFFEHITSKDGKRTWEKTEIVENAYMSPGLYREVRRDNNGQIEHIEISDVMHGRKLTLSPKDKKAWIEETRRWSHESGPWPFAYYYREKLNETNLQWIEKRKTNTGEVNVFRNAFKDHFNNDRNMSLDFWIDTKTKQLVAVYHPGADIYDPEKDLARNNPPEENYSAASMMGGADLDIRYDVPLDESLFQCTPPEGYTVELKRREPVTEKQVVDYLGILADLNDNMFPDTAFTSPDVLSKINIALKKPQKDLTTAERKFLETDERYTGHDPIIAFFDTDSESVVEKSFRYLGKGVKVGDKERIVCWYKLKNAKDPRTYRAVYGDLSVKDVSPAELPLPVE